MIETEKLEKVIKGLECHKKAFCFACPFNDGLDYSDRCMGALFDANIALIKRLSAFKEYFDDLYGTGLEVANYHMNGEFEPFDNFYDSAMEEINDG